MPDNSVYRYVYPGCAPSRFYTRRGIAAWLSGHSKAHLFGRGVRIERVPGPAWVDVTDEFLGVPDAEA
jgi:hypothetical protein